MAIQAQFHPEYFGLPLYGLQDLMLNNNPFFGFETDSCFAFQQPLFQQHHTWASSSSSSSTTFDSFLPQYLDAHYLHMQRQDVDSILQLQNKRLKSALQEQIRQQLTILLKSVESKASSLMKQKEEDLAQATNKTIDLEACLKKAQIERESWQELAKENEAMATNLSNKLEQVRERLLLSSDRGQDRESIISCGSGQRKEEEEEPKKLICKGCNSRVSSFMFLPCKHLCSCKSCEAFFVSCPVCESFKEGTIEVFWV